MEDVELGSLLAPSLHSIASHIGPRHRQLGYGLVWTCGSPWTGAPFWDAA